MCGGAAAFFTIWILVPAPLYVLWIAGIVGTEWSLWWGLLGLVGAVTGLQARRAGARTSSIVSLLLGVFAAAASLVPLFQSIPVAREQNVTLSAVRFFIGERGLTAQATLPPKTIPFATVSGQRLAMDVYPALTAESPVPHPAIIIIHGGSWNAGRKSDFAHWDRWLAAQGYTVFDIEYRVAPQPNWHEATEDVKTAVVWVKQNATQFRVDPDRIALLGRSAGGHLALLAAYTTSGKNGTHTSVRAVVSLYGPTDLAWGYYHPAKPDVIDGPGTLRRFLGGDPSLLPDIYAQASPVTHIGPNTPPTLLFHGERDLLVGPQHARRLSKRLADGHIPFQSVYIPYALHGFDFNINGWGSQIEQPVLQAFLRRHLAPRSIGQ